MKRIISIVLALMLFSVGCLAEGNTGQFKGLNDPELLPYMEDTVYQAVVDSLNSDEYFVDKEDLNRARDSANAAEREFRQELEFAYTNDRISEADKERLSAMLEYRDLFYDREDFACWKAYLTALEKQIEEISSA